MKVENLLPEVYYKESRDFGFVGRLLEVILNYAKLQADLSRTNYYNENVNKSLLALLARNVGFETKHEYINRDLLFIVKNFNDLVRRKGQIGAIEDAVKILARSQGIVIADPDNILTLDKDKGGKPTHSLIIRVPYGLTDTILLEDLFTYILPAGWVYEINYVSAGDVEPDEPIKIDYTDSNTEVYTYTPGTKLAGIYGAISGESTEDFEWPAITERAEGGKARATWYTGQVYGGEHIPGVLDTPEDPEA